MKSFSKTTTSTFTTTVTNTLPKITAAFIVLASSLRTVYSNSHELIVIDTGVSPDKNNGEYDELGRDVALSGDAQIMAVGAPYSNVNGKRWSGYVRLYGKDGTAWNMFQQIDDGYQNHFGWSVDLSYDGSTLAVSTHQSVVHMYELSNNTYLYELVYTTPDINAWEVSVSGDGSTVGVTSDTSSIGAMFFYRNGNGFQQRGSIFFDYGTWESGIALNYDGTIAAIGDRSWSTSTGRVGVFQDVGLGDWIQMGSDITGDSNWDYFGWYGSVSITYDGLTVAVGSRRYDSSRGLIRVYDYATTEGTWKKRADLVGDSSADNLSKTSLSFDGKYLAAGAYRSSSHQGSYVKIFEKMGGTYVVVEKKVESGRFGFSVDMSADGAAVVIGAPNFDDGYKGRAYVLVGNVQTQSPSFVPVVPTKIPSSVPSTSLLPSPSGNGNGDPHFTTFSGMSFDYHGECDLVMLSSPSFAKESGLSVHIRTTRMDGKLLSYSYISGAAVGIGNNVLEVRRDGSLLVNGKRNVNIDASLPTEFATYPFTKNMIGKKKKITQYVLNLTDTNNKPMGITIHANPKTKMLFVKIDGDFHDGIGLLGNPLVGNRLLGRDGVTDMSKDWNKYGEEWQVRETDQKLFQEHRAPQYPDLCIYNVSDDVLSKKTHNLRRRLLHDGEDNNGKVTREAANAVCEDFVGVNRDNCVYDVMVMGDLEVAEDPSYGI